MRSFYPSVPLPERLLNCRQGFPFLPSAYLCILKLTEKYNKLTVKRMAVRACVCVKERDRERARTQVDGSWIRNLLTFGVGARREVANLALRKEGAEALMEKETSSGGRGEPEAGTG